MKKIINNQKPIIKLRVISFLVVLISFYLIAGFGTIFTANAEDLTTNPASKSTIGGDVPKSTIGGDVPKSTFGGNVTPQNNIFTLQNPLKVNSLGELIQSFVQIFTYLVILFAVLMFIYIGFKYVTNAAQGNASEITKLHSQLMWLIVGVAVVIGARVLIQVVINTLSATGVVDPGVIQSANNAIGGK